MDFALSGLYRNVLDNMDLAIAIYRAVENETDFIFVDINRRAEEIDQVKKEHIIGMKVTEAFPGVEEFGLLDVFKRVYKTGVPESHPVSMYTDNRISGWRENYVYKLDSGEVVAVYKDEIERKQLEEELKRSWSEKNVIIEGAADPIVVSDEEKILFMNKRAVELFGFSASHELVGTPFLDLFGVEVQDVLRDRVRRRLRGEKIPAQYESVLLRRDGLLVAVEFNISVIEYDGVPAILNVIRDITLRKQSEEALRASEEKYRTLIENTDKGVFTLTDLHFTSVNPAGAKLFGYDNPEELIGQPVDSVYADQDEVKELRKQLYEKGRVTDFPLHIITKNNKVRVIATTSTQEVLEDGTILGTAIIRDITEQRQVENALIESEERYRSLFDDSMAGTLVRDNTGAITTINRTGAAIYGYEPHELIGKQVSSLWADPSQHENVETNLVEQGKSTELEIMVSRKDGSIGIVAANAFVRYDEEGNSSSFETYFRDVTEQKSAETKLRRSEGLFRGFMRSATDSFIIFDENLHYIQVNDAWLKLAQYTREEISGKHILDVYPGIKETGRYDAYLKVLETGVPVDFHTVSSRTGSRVIYDVSAFKAGNYLGVVVKDVSEQAHHRRQLEALNEHASQLASQGSIEEVISATFNIIQDIFGYNYGSFGLMEGDSLHHVIVPQVSEIDDFYQPISGSGVCPRAVRTGVTQVVNETRDDPDFSIAVAEGVYEPRSELVVPIQFDGKVGAVLNVESLSPGAFSDSDVRLVELLANHVRSNITRLHYFEQLSLQVVELEASKERWEELIASIPDPVLINNSMHYLYANQQAADLWEYDSPSDIIGQKVSLFFSEEDGEMLQQRARDRLSGADVPNRYEQAILKRDGSFVPVEVNIKVISFNGESAILGIYRDISERKQNEAGLVFERDRAERYLMRLKALYLNAAELYEASSIDVVGVKTMDVVDSILGFDQGGFGIIESDYLNFIHIIGRGRTLQGFKLPLSGHGVTVRAVKSKFSQLVCDVRLDGDFVLGSGEGFGVSLSELVVPLVVDGVVVGVINVESDELDAFGDEDRVLLETLAIHAASAIRKIRQVDHLEGLVEMRTREVVEGERLVAAGRVASMMAHDLKSPLLSINTATYMLRKKPDDSETYLQTIEEEVKRATRMMNDFRYQTIEESLRLTRVDLGALIRSSAEAANMPESVKVEYLLSDGVYDVLLDGAKMRRVLDNLIGNALDAMPMGGVLTLEAVYKRDGLMIRVSDTGDGMSEETVSNLFKVLYTTKPKGIGLGLAYCRRAVLAHGGEISVESEPNRGTTFTITIPTTIV